jgi:hypothetical protein
LHCCREKIDTDTTTTKAAPGAVVKACPKWRWGSTAKEGLMEAHNLIMDIYTKQ